MVTRWSRSTSTFYALIGQNLTGEFRRKLKFVQHLETCLLIAEVDRVLCYLVMFLTVFFHWVYKMKYAAFKIRLLFMFGLFIGNPISDGIVFTSLDV